ncbi:PoNe immunity protein domain-containing protein [Rubritalea spongiae]|uniref:PoNe immunity protein domain-containing protein n=1 Tax=Rubritalea spongiae TaxID=430797 RepID=A0ABW5E3D4_9BACT
MYSLDLSKARGQANTEEKQILSYLDRYIANSKEHAWSSYPKSWDNGKYFYFGTWAFEAAAVSAVTDIDDTIYRDHPYYPKELVDNYLCTP